MTDQEIDDLIAEFRPLMADKLVGYGGLALEARVLRALVRRAMQEGATLYELERERCARICERHAGLRGTGAWVALTAAAERIRDPEAEKRDAASIVDPDLARTS